MFNYHLDDQIGKSLNSEPKNEYKRPKEEEVEDKEVDEEEAPIAVNGVDAGHLAADEIIEEKNLQALIDKKESEEIEKEREEDREDLEKSYKRF
jgi:hypothetical protein